jgi:hypothetical protein
MPPVLADPKGHLTPAGLAALASARPGNAPVELATHLASCARCQDRMLSGATDGSPTRRERRAPPPPWRIWAVLAAALFLLLSILATIQRMR